MPPPSPAALMTRPAVCLLGQVLRTAQWQHSACLHRLGGWWACTQPLLRACCAPRALTRPTPRLQTTHAARSRPGMAESEDALWWIYSYKASAQAAQQSQRAPAAAAAGAALARVCHAVTAWGAVTDQRRSWAAGCQWLACSTCSAHHGWLAGRQHTGRCFVLTCHGLSSPPGHLSPLALPTPVPTRDPAPRPSVCTHAPCTGHAMRDPRAARLVRVPLCTRGRARGAALPTHLCVHSRGMPRVQQGARRGGSRIAQRTRRVCVSQHSHGQLLSTSHPDATAATLAPCACAHRPAPVCRARSACWRTLCTSACCTRRASARSCAASGQAAGAASASSVRVAACGAAGAVKRCCRCMLACGAPSRVWMRAC
jgi:hypothetical protein